MAEENLGWRASLGALAKGRSPSPALNVELTPLVPSQVGANTYHGYDYAYTKFNRAEWIAHRDFTPITALGDDCLTRLADQKGGLAAE